MCQHVQHVYHRFLIFYKYVRTIYVLFLGSETTIKTFNPVQWYQPWCCKVAFSQRDFDWLLSRNFGSLEIQMEIREIYGHKSANIHDITSLTHTLMYVPDVILDRKSLLLWKDINACVCACAHTHTHTYIYAFESRDLLSWVSALQLSNNRSCKTKLH